MEVFSQASHLFGYEGKPYFPHLSMTYGNLLLETKYKMIRGLGEIPEIEFEARQLSLVRASTRCSFRAGRLLSVFPWALNVAH